MDPLGMEAAYRKCSAPKSISEEVLANQNPVLSMVVVQVGVQVQVFRYTSLVECETGVVVATVSLFGAAGGVVLTAVTANG